MGTLGTEVDLVGVSVGVSGVDDSTTLGTGVTSELVDGSGAIPGGMVLVALG